MQDSSSGPSDDPTIALWHSLQTFPRENNAKCAFSIGAQILPSVYRLVGRGDAIEAQIAAKCGRDDGLAGFSQGQRAESGKAMNYNTSLGPETQSCLGGSNGRRRLTKGRLGSSLLSRSVAAKFARTDLKYYAPQVFSENRPGCDVFRSGGWGGPWAKYDAHHS